MAVEYCWAITLVTEGGHAAADQVQVDWSVDCICVSVATCAGTSET
jgi:hypothetical protein